MGKSKTLRRILQRNAPWHPRRVSSPNIALHSEVRIARNLKDHRFPNTSGQQELLKICKEIKRAVRLLPKFEKHMELCPGDFSRIDRKLVSEKLLYPSSGATRWESLLMLSADLSVHVRINVEDHLHLIVSKAGGNIRTAWKEADSQDSLLAEELPFSFKAGLGFLTAAPENVGTGLRASVALHVPGLTLAAQLKGVVNALDKLGFRVTGFDHDPGDIKGNIIRVSNRDAIGKAEDEIIADLENEVNELTALENQARQLLLETQPELLYDFVSRSYATLRYAHVLGDEETIELLSALRLGVDAGMLTTVDHRLVNNLALRVRPAHLRMTMPPKTSSHGENVERARFVRSQLDSVR